MDVTSVYQHYIGCKYLCQDTFHGHLLVDFVDFEPVVVGELSDAHVLDGKKVWHPSDNTRTYPAPGSWA